jgi:hypothetical protein
MLKLTGTTLRCCSVVYMLDVYILPRMNLKNKSRQAPTLIPQIPVPARFHTRMTIMPRFMMFIGGNVSSRMKCGEALVLE